MGHEAAGCEGEGGGRESEGREGEEEDEDNDECDNTEFDIEDGGWRNIDNELCNVLIHKGNVQITLYGGVARRRTFGRVEEEDDASVSMAVLPPTYSFRNPFIFLWYITYYTTYPSCPFV